MGLIQIDSVNVLARSQELTLFARLGPHPRTLIDDATRHGDLFEFWVHEACHVPIELYPLQRWAMHGHARWKSLRAWAVERTGLRLMTTGKALIASCTNLATVGAMPAT